MSDILISTINPAFNSLSNNDNVYQNNVDANKEAIGTNEIDLASFDFGSSMIRLAKPTLEQRHKIESYVKGKKIGVNPILPNPPYGSNYININFTNRTTHNRTSPVYEYSQKSFDLLYQSNPAYVLINTVNAFVKDSEMERGIVVNFFAA